MRNWQCAIVLVHPVHRDATALPIKDLVKNVFKPVAQQYKKKGYMTSTPMCNYRKHYTPPISILVGRMGMLVQYFYLFEI